MGILKDTVDKLIQRLKDSVRTIHSPSHPLSRQISTPTSQSLACPPVAEMAPIPDQQEPRSTEETKETRTEAVSRTPSERTYEKTPKRKRDPYFIQVGFDFGTSYCKCVYRDIALDKAWVHIADSPADREYPFLLTSALQVKDGLLFLAQPTSHYHEGGLPHVKTALVKVTRNEWDDPVLQPFERVAGKCSHDDLRSFVTACAVYLLAGALGSVRKDVRTRYAGFDDHCGDYMAVNLAIPVADAQHPEINELFSQVLYTAFFHADKFVGYPPLPLTEIAKLALPQEYLIGKLNSSEDGPCHIYPEVSAGIQGFVRSRVSKEGIYFFSDAGAESVDQSVFIFWREAGKGDRLTYLYASVLSLGSSHIERKAAERSGNTSWQSLEEWRKKKETGDDASELRAARTALKANLRDESLITAWRAREKLISRAQFQDIRLLFGGGGHSKVPYEVAVMDAFEDWRLGMASKPPIIGMPPPKDLEPSAAVRLWMHRLWVAYGLSFPWYQLPGQMYPSQVPKPDPTDIWQPKKEIPAAISKDEC